MLRKAEIAMNETRMFWRLCQELKSDDAQVVAEALDEMDVLRLHTDSPVLKEQCSRMIAVMHDRAAGAERRALA